MTSATLLCSWMKEKKKWVYGRKKGLDEHCLLLHVLVEAAGNVADAFLSRDIKISKSPLS